VLDLSYRTRKEGKMFDTKKAALAYVGGLSAPEKMPCPAYNLQPFVACPTGRKLAGVSGSVCADCYGTKGHYALFQASIWPAWQARFSATKKRHFVAAMTKAIAGRDYFRWHDTGDVYSDEYMRRIVAIACNLPDTRFWLPTREYGRVTKFRDMFPENLRVRVSLPTVNPPDSVVAHYIERYGFVSTVVESGHTCRMVKVKGRNGDTVSKCGDCRDCWGAGPCVSYKLH
jgi:hypothetical protein